MANLWQFFGLPDPEGPPRDEEKKAGASPTKTASNKPQPSLMGSDKQVGQERNLRGLTDAIEAAKSGRKGASPPIPTNWKDDPSTTSEKRPGKSAPAELQISLFKRSDTSCRTRIDIACHWMEWLLA